MNQDGQDNKEKTFKWFPKPPTKRKMMFRKSISNLKSSNASKGPKAQRETPVLQLTSLIDMFTIILIFLLLNFSTDPNQSPPPMDVNLPSIITEEELDEKPMVGINVVTANSYSITLDQTSIIQSAQGMPVKTDTFIPLLLDKLRETYEIAIQTAEINQIDPDSVRVIIQADSLVSYNLITQIVNTCTMAGYKKVSVMVLAPKF
ncbi:biopolymer transporter ExbD [candidate division WOR-3 bacterium]|nr:biopolymer transporter ExbD [candidate division WOR-3 bacterium]